MMYRYLSLFFFFFIHFCSLTAQEEKIVPFSHLNHEMGLPYVKNYPPNLYQAGVQNWDAVQDSLGIMYFANSLGVLTYNGTSWNMIKMPNGATVFSLAIANEGKIYAAGIDELGYLASSNQGVLSFVSLLEKLPEEFQDFGQIRSIEATTDGVFFASVKYILKWDGSTFTTWENSGDRNLFQVNNILYKRFKGKGLTTLKNGQFELVPHGEHFSDKSITTILSFEKDSLLIATENKLYTYDGNDLEVFKTNTPTFFIDNKIRHGISIDQNNFALGSSKKGILILDKNGNKMELFSKERVLRSVGTLAIFQDKSGLLWSLSNNGITKIEYPSPFSFFNRNNNTPDGAIEFLRHRDTLYVGTSDGLYYLNDSKNLGNPTFQVVDNDYGIVFDMISYKGSMLVASSTGLHELNAFGRSRRIGNTKRALTICASKTNPNRVYFGTSTGLISMINPNENWTLEHDFEEVTVPVPKIFENKNGDLWLDIAKNEVIGISFKSVIDAKNLRDPKVKTYLAADGVPENLNKIYLIKDKLYVKAKDEAYLFDPKTGRFSLDKKLFKSLGFENKTVEINAVDDDGNIWLIEYKEEQRLEQFVAILQEDGTYRVKKLNQKRIIDIRKYGMYPELKDSVVWFKGRPGVVRQDLRSRFYKTGSNSRAIITEMFLNNDSLLFGGYESSIVHQLPFKNNPLRFKYASPSFYDESQNQFQVYLEGFDEGWSTWTTETQKDYTNIPEGDYSFKVRSKNIFNNIGKEDRYIFIILPPWYRTWWMYLIYGLLGIATFMGISQYRSKELLRKNENLEDIVKKRTIEIQQKNELLNQQTEKLVQLNDARTQLYANITHEFRTPLTVILGMADTLESKKLSGVEKSLEMIKRNGKKLLQLVNEMLDLAKLESGTMELHLVQTNIVPFVKYLSESFHSLAETKKINLTVYSEIEDLEMDFDANKMSSIISNLLSNAIKFTPKHGKIVVHLNKINEKDTQCFVIKIKDNGIGIAEDEMANLFNRFYQVDNSSTRQGEGTGIGLSLVKEFTELMNGTIGVKSTPRKGSTFTIQIPVTHTAVKTTEAKIKVDPPILAPTSKNDITRPLLDNDTALPLVLIIEDNEDVAHYLRTSLKGKYQAIHAINGIAGIEMALKNIPDIIITDVMMPGKDGFEVCATLKSNELTDHIPIIMLTAKATIKDRLTGLSHGADAYLAKPFVKAELFTRLDQLVSLRKKLLRKFQNNGFGQLLNEREVTRETKFLQKTIQLIQENITDSNFGASQLAFKLNLSESQVYRKLKAITDKSTAVFIRSIRLQRGKELIQTTDKTVSEVAYEVGFNDPSWFSKAFKEEFGFAPSET